MIGIKFVIVDICQLDTLMQHCSVCASINSVERKRVGSVITYHTRCFKHDHQFSWSTTPKEKNTPIFNILLAAAIFCAGIGYTTIRKMTDAIGLAFFSHQTFYSHINNFTAPILRHSWIRMREEIFKDLQSKDDLVVSGDARFDSPGHSAKYALYSIMSNFNNKIIDFVLWQKGFLPGEMESKSCAYVFNRLVEKLGVGKVRIFCTDRNPSVAKMMRENFKDVEHAFDVWHLAKGLRKKLIAVAKKHKQIEGWIEAIVNHIWHVSSTCGGDSDTLLEKWNSMLYHIRGKHQWKEGKETKTCDHRTYEDESEAKIDWITDESAFAALKKVTHNTRFLNQLKHCKHFVHTGNLESFHNVILVYASKRVHFFYENMLLKTILAVLDHNHNTGRASVGTKTTFSKLRKTYQLETKYEEKCNEWRANLLEEIEKYAKSPGLLGTEEEEILILSPPHDVPRNINSVPLPSREELELRRNIRMRAAEHQIE
ncbi:uncharacterized protein LOC135940755 [Cloeon dipterum]|uniref:uncharacterized protein LOC135937282 n=1 Tax=Cloeon dipterum TaxID=197152 RepID=UPI0032207ED7